MDEACVMAFPGMGVMKATEVIESVKKAPRWTSVDMTECKIGRAGADVIALAYHAVGKRDGDEPYQCWCTSTYRRNASDWYLVQHQQTVDS